MTLQDLPALNATLNGISTLFLLAGFFFIKRQARVAHRNCMVGALVTSALFLTSYLIYHYNVPSTKFLEPSTVRPFYLLILFTHVVLAVAILPLILLSFHRAVKERYELHKRISRWTWPLWMYVSVTGVVIYLMLYQIWPQSPLPHPAVAPAPLGVAAQP